MKKYIIFLFAFFSFVQATAQLSPKENYQLIQKKLQTGWGTYNHKSVLSHVLLPECFALNIGFKLKGIETNGYLKDAYISSRDARPETITPGIHSLDGTYTDLTVQWKQLNFRLQSAVTPKDELVLLITPIGNCDLTANVIIESGMLWNKPGIITKKGRQLTATTSKKIITVHAIGNEVDEFVAASAPYMAVEFNKEIAVYTGGVQTIESIKKIIASKRKIIENEFSKYGELSSTCTAIQNVIGWNIIYDAAQNRVIFPVSRLWNDIFGGQSVLFDWDTYFGAYMASINSKELAYANAIEATKSIEQFGFVPNWSGSYRLGSFDRSQPPVGSLVIKELYRRYREKWLLQYVFDDLLKWNRWWPSNRDDNGMLCWGSNKVLPPLKGDGASNEWQGAAYESGLDNSPMYDSIPFNKEKNMLALADAGLMGMYVMDCDALAQIATILNKTSEVSELTARANKYRTQLKKLWNEQAGIFLNKRTDTDIFSDKISPTNFYPLLGNAASQTQAQRMMKEHLLNPEEFNGQWMLPSISMKDATFKEQKYWRGRIWGPMNFLVYIGLMNYNLPEARKILAKKSNQLFIENVGLNGYVYENYNCITGNIINPAEGKREGDNYYHWGALLGFISLIENGFVPDPSKPIQ